MQSAQPTPVDVFLRTHPDRGGLRVHIFYRGVTDCSGILSGIRLPAPPFAWSQASDTAALSGLDYQVSVQHPMFQPVAGRTATVFDGVETILPVMLEPVV